MNKTFLDKLIHDFIFASNHVDKIAPTEYQMKVLMVKYATAAMLDTEIQKELQDFYKSGSFQNF